MWVDRKNARQEIGLGSGELNINFVIFSISTAMLK